MGIVYYLPRRRHARASKPSRAEAGKQSSAVTRPSVSALIAAAKGADSQVLPFRMRLMVDRSHETPRARMRDAIASSSNFFADIQSASCMSANVYQMHNNVKSDCVPMCMENPVIGVHHAHAMVPRRKQKPQPKPQWRPSNLRLWREDAGKTLEEVAEKMGLSHGQLSRVERGLSPWNQKILETAALEYRCSVVDLLENAPRSTARKAS